MQQEATPKGQSLLLFLILTLAGPVAVAPWHAMRLTPQSPWNYPPSAQEILCSSPRTICGLPAQQQSVNTGALVGRPAFKCTCAPAPATATATATPASSPDPLTPTWAAIDNSQAQEATERNVCTSIQGHHKGLKWCHVCLLSAILCHIHVGICWAQQCWGWLGHIHIHLNGLCCC